MVEENKSINIYYKEIFYVCDYNIFCVNEYFLDFFYWFDVKLVFYIDCILFIFYD